ncbi:hypothetical protein ZYGR_0AG02520 [Zygosaccharomyces rouxii]|uniref:2,5-diamino-6-ribosylamino-4(3H)-pyrimidinone 5'-phosphate reductase n=1 Tax=Zygosaccharomyces rouxii TaxID=4956 RepID=A0A1Q3A9F3_ZYGRO|nr:hypothetical protein ZYGR_0AG02520 [Zygosaccharomyces rouxii]
MSLVPLKPDLPPFLSPYLPTGNESKPFITLTYAQSLDSRISKGHGIRTAISHPETKTMTHYLRYHHDGILVGTGTALADDPGLNCKYNGAVDQSPRPIILNHSGKWKFSGSKLQELYENGHGKKPIVVVSELPMDKDTDVDYLVCQYRQWGILFDKLHREYGLKSIMVEGGANVINQLLMSSGLVNSLIITVGPVYLGEKGVSVSPAEPLQLKDVDWWKGTSDVVMCARLH